MSKVLLSGSAAVDITPLDFRRVYLAGFDPNRKAAGVLDPIYARALFLDDGNTSLAIVACDLIGLLLPTVEQIRSAVRVVPKENVFVCSTHTHSGPDTVGFWGPTVAGLPSPLVSGVDEGYLAVLQERIVHAIRRAKKKAVPAEIAFAEDRSVKDFTWNVRDPGVMDHAVSVMRVERADGNGTIAILTNYASHPEALWSVNRRISPDYPALIHRTLERKYGGTSMFISGALGAMVTPGIEESASLDRRESFYSEYGSKLAKVVSTCADRAQVAPDPLLEVRTRQVMLPVKNPIFTFAAGLSLFNREFSRDGIRTEVGHIRIGPAHVAACPGELAPAVGMRLKRAMQGSPSFLFGLCNDEIGYVLERQMFEDDKYTYERSMSVGPDTADLLIETCLGLANSRG